MVAPNRRAIELPARGRSPPAFEPKEFSMDWNIVEGNWPRVRTRIKDYWGHLTDEDLDKIAGKREKLEGKLRERYGLSREFIRWDVDDWLKGQ
jgi:uncharacterized protein YjbJ (UPF0337 family)